MPDYVRAEICSNLSTSLLYASQIEGRRPDFDEAVSSARYAVALSSEDDSNYPMYLNNLASALLARGAEWQLSADVSASIECARHAVARSQLGSDKRRHRLITLADACRVRYESEHSPDDLRLAEVAIRDVANSTPPGDPDRGRRLIALSNITQLRYEVLQDRASLDEAVALARAGSAALTPSSLMDQITAAMSLGAALLLKFARDHNRTSLNEAIGVKRRAVTLAASGPLRLPTRMNLCRALLASHVNQVVQHRWGVTELQFIRRNSEEERDYHYVFSVDMTDLMEAVSIARSACAEVAASSPYRSMAFSILSMALGEYTRCLDELEDDPVQQFTQQLHSMTRAAANRQTEYSQWNPALYDKRAKASLLNERVEAARISVSCAETPQIRVDREYELALALQHRFKYGKRLSDLRNASEKFAIVANSSSTDPAKQCMSSRQWAECESEMCHWDVALLAYSNAIRLLPRLVFSTPGQNDQLFRLENHEGVSGDAAAVAINCANLEDAIRLLEEGRTVILNRAVSGISNE